MCILLQSGNNRRFTIRRSHMQGVHPDLRYTDIYCNLTNCESGQPRLPVAVHMRVKVHKSLFLHGYEHQYSKSDILLTVHLNIFILILTNLMH